MEKIYALIIISSFSFLCNTAHSQGNMTSLNLDSLYNARLHLDSQGSDYSHIEWDIVNSGSKPSALAKVETPAGSIKYTFKIYSPVSGSENEQRMESRFRSTFSEIQFIEIRSNLVTVLFNNSITAENINLFFQYFGYSSVQPKN